MPRGHLGQGHMNQAPAQTAIIDFSCDLQASIPMRFRLACEPLRRYNGSQDTEIISKWRETLMKNRSPVLWSLNGFLGGFLGATALGPIAASSPAYAADPIKIGVIAE